MKTSDLNKQLKKYWKQQLHLFHQLLNSGEAIGIVGLYGVGKKFFIDYLINNVIDDLVIEINLKENKPQTSQEIYSLIVNQLKKNKLISKDISIPNTDFEFHYLIKKVINQSQKNNKNKRIVIIFNESQQFLKLPESFWDNLTSLQFHQKKYLQLLFVGQPGLINFSTEASQRLLHNNFIYIQPFSKTLIKKIIENEKNVFSSKDENFLWKYSNGHYGTAKYLLRKINQYKINNNSSSPILNKKLFQNLFENDPLLILWIKQAWSQFTPEQQFIIGEYLETKSIKTQYLKLDSFLELVKLGLFSKQEKNIKFFLVEFIELIKKNTTNKSMTNKKIFAKDNKIFIDNLDVSSMFTSKEQKIFTCLLAHKEKYVSYEKLGDSIWEQKSEDKYSLWALSKLISRLRKKLPKLGFSKKTIKTVRNRGYTWYNLEY